MGRWLAVAGLSGLIAIAVGAFGAHFLAGRLGATAMSLIVMGTVYQMIHTLALLAVALLTRERLGQGWTIDLAGWSFASGIVLFCGSLYLLALTGQSPAGWITPLGGMAFMVGWAALARHGFMLWRER